MRISDWSSDVCSSDLIWLGNEFTVDLDDNGPVRSFGKNRRGQQKRGEKLAGHRATHPHWLVRQNAPLSDRQRRIPFIAQIPDIGPQGTKRIHHIPNRAPVHARHPRPPVLSTPKTHTPSHRDAHGSAEATKTNPPPPPTHT